MAEISQVRHTFLKASYSLLGLGQILGIPEYLSSFSEYKKYPYFIWESSRFSDLRFGSPVNVFFLYGFCGICDLDVMILVYFGFIFLLVELES